MGWRLLAVTGMRRGEALTPHWRDVDLDASRLVVRRSVGVVENQGAVEQLVDGPTKTGQERVVELNAGTVVALRACRAVRGGLPLDLVRDSALVRGNLNGINRHPERFSRRFAGRVVQARKALGEDRLPVIRLHDLRHTHATLLAARSAPRPVHAVVGQSLLSDEERHQLGLQRVLVLGEMSDADPSRDRALSRRLAAAAGELLGRSTSSPVVAGRG
jgi:integrase